MESYCSEAPKLVPKYVQIIDTLPFFLLGLLKKNLFILYWLTYFYGGGEKIS